VSWIDELKVGDPVIYGWSQYGQSSYRKKTITKVTPTRVEVDNTTFTKKDGRQYGAGMYAPYITIEPWDKTNARVIKTLENDKRSHWMVVIRKCDLINIPSDVLESIAEQLSPYQVETK
jgi:hypothetical protein